MSSSFLYHPMNESKLAGTIILAILALIPIGFVSFGSKFTPIAPLVIAVGISIFGILSQRKKRKKKQDLKRMRDELLQSRWEDDVKN